MAPASFSRVRRAAAEEPSPASTPTNTISGLEPNINENPSATTTTTILIIVCATAIMSAAIFYLFDRKKNRQFREACKRDPYLTRKEFARRRKLSAVERLEEEELQRSIMIRKSLASRTHSRSNSNFSSDEESDLGTMAQHRMPEPPCEHSELLQQHQPQQDHHLHGEWAPSESRRTRSDSESSSSQRRYTEPHPGVEVEIPPPPQSRTPSPTRAPLIRKPEPPPMPAVIYGQSLEDVPRPLPSLPRA